VEKLVVVAATEQTLLQHGLLQLQAVTISVARRELDTLAVAEVVVEPQLHEVLADLVVVELAGIS
jgi:hypothetical protein